MHLKRLRLLFAALLTAIMFAAFPQTSHANEQPDYEVRKGHTEAIYVYRGEDGNPVAAIKNYFSVAPHNRAVIVFSDATYSDSYNFAPLGEHSTVGYYPHGNGTYVRDFMHPGLAHRFGEDAKVYAQVTGVRGPGRIAMFDNPASETGQITPYLPSGEFLLSAGETIPIPAHRHLVWYFTHPGNYQIDATVVVAKGCQVQRTEPFTLRFKVERAATDTREAVPYESSAAMPALPTPDPATCNQQGGENPDPAAGSGDSADGNDSSTPGNGGDNADGGSANPGAGEQPGNGTGSAEQPGNGGAPGDAPGNGAATPTDGPVYEVAPDVAVIRSGHVDGFHVVPQSGGLLLNIMDDSSEEVVEREVAKTVFFVSGVAKQELSAVFQRGTGLTQGYYISENGEKQEDLIFPGWDSAQLEDLYTDISYNFVEVTGPGRVFLFKNKRSGGAIPALADSQAELRAGTQLLQKRPSHEHGHWIFERPGVYTMTLTVSATDEEGQRITSAPATYVWVVDQPIRVRTTPPANQPGDGADSSGSQNNQGDNGNLGNQNNQSGPSGNPADGNHTVTAGQSGNPQPQTITQAPAGNPTAAQHQNPAALSKTGTASSDQLATMALLLGLLAAAVLRARGRAARKPS